MNQTLFDQQKPLGVQQFVEAMDRTLQELGSFRVQGEISKVSNLNRRYEFLTLQDTDAEDFSVECFIAGRALEQARHLLREGMEVVVQGTPGVYKNGRFRVMIQSVEPVGEGALRRAFEELKQELEQTGYFDEDKKLPLPAYIRRIGLITSETGAAVRDFQRNLGEYGFRVSLVNVKVEGTHAVREVTGALRWLNGNRPELDVIVLIRGGGGLESMKAFNSREVAEAVFTSRIPVIVGVGHEQDETIAGFAADRVVSTPTAAAQLIRSAHEELITRTKDAVRELSQLTHSVIQEQFATLSQLSRELIYACESSTRERRAATSRLSTEMTASVQRILESAKHRTSLAEQALQNLNPESVLERGYSITAGPDGRPIRDAADVSVDDTIVTRLHSGRLESTVTKRSSGDN